MAFFKCQSSDHDLTNSNSFQIKKNKPYKHTHKKKLALKLGIQNYQILTNDDEVCTPSLSSILLVVLQDFTSEYLIFKLLSIFTYQFLKCLIRNCSDDQMSEKKYAEKIHRKKFYGNIHQQKNSSMISDNKLFLQSCRNKMILCIVLKQELCCKKAAIFAHKKP